jgi:hypothetical protein
MKKRKEGGYNEVSYDFLKKMMKNKESCGH